MIQAEILDRSHMVFLLRGFLSPKECEEYVARAEAMGFTMAPITTSAGPRLAPEVRDNSRVMVDDPALAAALWQRLEPWVPEAILDWEALGLNDRFRFYRYDAGQRFSRHFDGAYHRSPNERSQLSFIVYLNDGFEGGETTFFTELGELRFRVRPERGAALLFLHAQLHEGSPVRSGTKYAVRSDVMYLAGLPSSGLRPSPAGRGAPTWPPR